MRRQLSLLLLSIAALGPCCAQGLGLDEYLRQVWERSRQVQAKKDSSDIASNDQWRRFIPNEPQLWFISQDDSGWQQAGLNLTVPFPGRTFLNMSGDSARARVAKLDYGATKLDVTKGAMDLFLDCASAKKAL